MDDLRPVFQEMRRQLAARGWIQHNLESPLGVCLLGAVEIAVLNHHQPEKTDEFMSAQDEVIAALVAAIYPGGQPSYHDTADTAVIRWNDRYGRTYAEVDALLASLSNAPVEQPEDEAVCV